MQKEDCSPGDSTSDSSEKLLQRGKGEGQYACDFGEGVVLSCSLCLALFGSMDCNLPGSSVLRILQALEWVAILQGIFPTQGLNLHLLCLLVFRQILYH